MSFELLHCMNRRKVPVKCVPMNIKALYFVYFRFHSVVQLLIDC